MLIFVEIIHNFSSTFHYEHLHVFGIKHLRITEYAYEYCLRRNVEEDTLERKGKRKFLEEAAAGFRRLFWMFSYNFVKKNFNDDVHHVAYYRLI